MNANLFSKAKSTNGFFDEEEALFLIDEVNKLPDDARILEIGSYYGRSTLFMLSAMSENQSLVSLDTFEKLTGYTTSSHSFWNLKKQVDDPRHTILPIPISEAFQHINTERFDLIFVDGNHSLLGLTQDLCYSILLAKEGANILCHDVYDEFPGVILTLDSFVSYGILEPFRKARTLGGYTILKQPDWLINPGRISDK